MSDAKLMNTTVAERVIRSFPKYMNFSNRELHFQKLSYELPTTLATMSNHSTYLSSW
jgi:hypothetical protein